MIQKLIYKRIKIFFMKEGEKREYKSFLKNSYLYFTPRNIHMEYIKLRDRSLTLINDRATDRRF